MNGTTLSCVISTPLTSPQIAAAATAPSAASNGLTFAAEQQRDHDGAQGDDRPDRQIDAARHDDHRHAEGRHADDCRLPRHQLEIRRLEELPADQQAKQHGDGDESQQRSGPIDQRARRHALPTPVVAAMTRSCSVSIAAGTGGARPASPHHRNPVAQAEQLGQIAADHQDRFGGRAVGVGDERVDQTIDLRLAADVDPARRFVEDQDVDVVMEETAIAIFCWFPPDSSAAAWSGPAHLMSSCAIHRSAALA